MRQVKRTIAGNLLLLAFVGILLGACGGPLPETAPGIADQTEQPAVDREYPPEIPEASEPSQRAWREAFDPDKTIIPLSDEIMTGLDPDRRFSLGLDRMVRDDFSALDHKHVLVITNRLALDSEGIHLLEHLLPKPKPIVRRAVIFRDESMPRARSTAIDRILAGYPNVRVFERSEGAFRLTPGMIEEIDVILIDLPLRGGTFRAETGFLAGVLTDAALNEIPVILLDRPSPNNGLIYGGPAGDRKYHGRARSFFPVMPVMGLTTGEFATLYSEYFGLDVDMDVIELLNWDRRSGARLLLEHYRRLGIEPGRNLEEWSEYYPANSIAGQLRLVRDMVPESKSPRVDLAGGNPRLLLNPAPLTARDFQQALERFEFEGASTAPASVDGVSAVAISLERLTDKPVLLAVCVWSVYAGADQSILPESGNPDPFGTDFVFDGLRQGRDPRDLHSSWSGTDAYRELENRRQRVLRYEQ